MHVSVVTLFPDLIRLLGGYGVIGRALANEDDKTAVRGARLDTVNPRDFAGDGRGTVDAKPYGGGPGMLMMAEPLLAALDEAQRKVAARTGETARVIYMSPQGGPLRQQDLQRLATESGLVVLAGRYEGLDERVLESRVDEEFSVGDFVVSGGELPAMLLLDGLLRLLPGTLGDSASAAADSFADGLLEGPQYTRPEETEAGRVPEVLLSGDHAAIARWRRREALGRTWCRRPDLLRGRALDRDDLAQLADFVIEWTGRNKEDDS